jgi:hypothetical protein
MVFVDERTSGKLRSLDAVRAAVRTEWLAERRFEAEQNLYRKLRDRYEIIVEVSPVKSARSQGQQ